MGTFPTKRSGSRQECRAWVKRFRSIDKAPYPACWVRTGLLSEAPVQSSSEGCHDVAAGEAKAQVGNGLRVAVEASNKPLTLVMGYLTHFLTS